MKQLYCTMINGEKFCEETKKIVWEDAKPIYGKANQKHLKRKDRYGNEIHYNKYGKTDSKYGWEIDHKKPKSRKQNTPDRLTNLQPLQWKENRRKSNTYPYSETTRKKRIEKETNKQK